MVCVDYVSKWVEAYAYFNNDAKTMYMFLKKLFARFRMPRARISDGGIHFCNKNIEILLDRYEVRHKVATPYHPQTSEKIEVSNRN